MSVVQSPGSKKATGNQFSLSAAQRSLISQALEASSGNITEAADACKKDLPKHFNAEHCKQAIMDVARSQPQSDQ